jgi:hypothetical protein
MADTITPTFSITRPQLAAFAPDPRTVNDLEAFIRMVREEVPGIISVKVDETRQIIAGSGLTGTHDLSADVTLSIGAGTGIAVSDDAVSLADTAVAPGAYGDATHVGQFTVDQQGRLTFAGSVAITFPAAYTDEQAQDAVAAMLTAGAGIALSYNDVANTLSISSSAAAISAKDEGSTLTSALTSINWVGSGVTATNSSGDVTVTLNEATTAQYQANTANKLLLTDKVWSAAGQVTLTDAATIAVDFSSGFNFTVTLGSTIGATRALGNPSNLKDGQCGCIEILQDGTGSRALTYSSNWKFAGGTAPVLTTTASARDLLFYEVVGSIVFGTMAKDVK